MAETPEDQFERTSARGNLVALRIVDYPGEGLVIHWVNSMVKPTLISSDGDEKPMYDFLKNRFPDFKKAAGAGLTVVADDNGLLEGIGEIDGEIIKPLERHQSS